MAAAVLRGATKRYEVLMTAMSSDLEAHELLGTLATFDDRPASLSLRFFLSIASNSFLT
jgi:hypothetical protein